MVLFRLKSCLRFVITMGRAKGRVLLHQDHKPARNDGENGTLAHSINTCADASHLGGRYHASENIEPHVHLAVGSRERDPPSYFRQIIVPWPGQLALIDYD